MVALKVSCLIIDKSICRSNNCRLWVDPDALMNTERRIKKKRGQLYRRFTTSYVWRSVKIGRFSPSTMLCSPSITEDVLNVSWMANVITAKPLNSRRSLAVLHFLEFAVHSYLKTFSNKNYDSQQPCGMTETRELKQWWRRRQRRQIKKKGFLLPIIQICSVHRSVRELTQKNIRPVNDAKY